jgi:hypothetical protein
MFLHSASLQIPLPSKRWSKQRGQMEGPPPLLVDVRAPSFFERYLD